MTEFEYQPLSYGALHNGSTQQKHIIVFKDAPRPSDYHSNLGTIRMKSVGHFNGMTQEELDLFKQAIKNCNKRWIGEFNWDGVDTPAYILDRSITEEEKQYLEIK